MVGVSNESDCWILSFGLSVEDIGDLQIGYFRQMGNITRETFVSEVQVRSNWKKHSCDHVEQKVYLLWAIIS